MPRGIFITFEGPEGAGKTTQIRLLKEWLDQKKIFSFVTREPGGTELAETLRDIVKHYKGEEQLTNQTELLLFSAARSQHVSHLIEPAIAAGKIVICDRFSDSTTAYQGYGRGINLDFIKKLNQFATHGLQPDITILLDLPPEIGLCRAQRRQEPLFKDDRIENLEMDFHQKVRSGYLQLAQLYPNRFHIVNANKMSEEIHQKICQIITPWLTRVTS